MQTESITIHATNTDILLPTTHLRELLTANHVSEEIIKSCETALADLLKKIVVDAYHNDEQQLITVNISYNGKGVYIETQDEGIPSEIPVHRVIAAKNLLPPEIENEPENESETEKKKDILDEVWYEVDMGKNIWQLVKYI
jgi:anti-sigma regulatory factor (Ser/Thr protein kinase)